MWIAVAYAVTRGKLLVLYTSTPSATREAAYAQLERERLKDYRLNYPTKQIKVLVGELVWEVVPPLDPSTLELKQTKEEPMWGATLYQNTAPTVKTSSWAFVSGFSGDTREKVAAQALKVAQQYQASYPSHAYKVLVGELTHEVIPPEMQVEFKLADPVV